MRNREAWAVEDGESSRVRSAPLGSAQLGLRRRLRNSLASSPRARDHVDAGHVMLADISENGIILTYPRNLVTTKHARRGHDDRHVNIIFGSP